jgi:hypothetical protein
MHAKTTRYVRLQLDPDIVEFARVFRLVYEAAHPGRSLSVPQAAIAAAEEFERSGDATCTIGSNGDRTWTLTGRRRARLFESSDQRASAINVTTRRGDDTSNGTGG